MDQEDEAKAREELHAAYEAHTTARLAVAAAETRLNMLPGVVSLPLWVNRRKDRGAKTSRGEVQPVRVTDQLLLLVLLCGPTLLCWGYCDPSAGAR